MKYLIILSLLCTTCETPRDSKGRLNQDDFWNEYCFHGRVFVETQNGLVQFLDTNGKPETCQSNPPYEKE